MTNKEMALDGQNISCRRCSTQFHPSPAKITRKDWMCKACSGDLDRAYRARRRAIGIKNSGKHNPIQAAAYRRRYSATEHGKRMQAAYARKRLRDPRSRYKHQARWQLRHA